MTAFWLNGNQNWILELTTAATECKAILKQSNSIPFEMDLQVTKAFLYRYKIDNAR